jgi:hypothetical protein
MSAHGSDLPEAKGSKPDIGEILRPRPDEAQERGAAAEAALFVGPVLVVAAIGTVFVAFPLAIGLLVLAPGVLSLGWLPGAPPRRAPVVAATTALILGLAVGALGLLANRCAADPAYVGVAGGTLMAVAFLAATAVGRVAAIAGHRLTAILAAGAVGAVGFGLTLAFVITKVFVLC